MWLPAKFEGRPCKEAQHHNLPLDCKTSPSKSLSSSTDKVNQTYTAAGSERRISILLLRCIGHAYIGRSMR